MSVLTVPLTPRTIHTVLELATDPRPVTGFATLMFGVHNKSTEPHVQNIAQSFIIHYNYGLAIQNVSEANVVMCDSRVTLDYIIR